MKTALVVTLCALALAGFGTRTWSRDASGPNVSTAASAQAKVSDELEDAIGDDPAWDAYEVSLEASMRAGNKPRDWALAALSGEQMGKHDAAATTPASELARAAEIASDDALVQWLAANNQDTKSTQDNARIASAIARLTRLESDNGAAWMLAMSRASKRQDQDAVDDALSRMAASPRFDDHFADTLHAWLAAYDRHPPATPFPVVMDGRAQMSATFAAAFAKTASTALPPYGPLLHACKPAPDRAIDVHRGTQCAAVGRLMLYRGTTLIVKAIGFAVLRDLGDGVLTDEDRSAKRNLDWYRANLQNAIGYYDGDAAFSQAHEADWRNMDDELEVIKSALRRAGLPTEAPAGWAPST